VEKCEAFEEILIRMT